MDRAIAKTLFALVVIAASQMAGVRSASAQVVDRSLARKVQAGFLYKFARYVHWPQTVFENEKAPLIIGVLGDDPFGPVLVETVKGKQVGQRSVEIRRFNWNNKKDRGRTSECHVLFISSSEEKRFDEIRASLDGSPVLLVGDMEGFAQKGGMIGFVLEKDRIAFQINRVAVERTELKVSSRLLRLARIVEPKRQDNTTRAGK